jgi:hypothetical protein
MKKADVGERPEAFAHVGLLGNGPPARPGCPSSSHPTFNFSAAGELKSF